MPDNRRHPAYRLRVEEWPEHLKEAAVIGKVEKMLARHLDDWATDDKYKINVAKVADDPTFYRWHFRRTHQGQQDIMHGSAKLLVGKTKLIARVYLAR